MLRILLVEDKVEKRQMISEVISRIDHKLLEYVDCAADVKDAKKYLRTTKYGLLLLDINIPASIDVRVGQGVGLEVITYIRDNDQAIAPNNIVAISAYDDAIESANHEMAGVVWKILKFSFDDLEWQSQLISIIKFARKSWTAPYVNDGNNNHVDLAIVVALDEELKPILELPGDWSEVSVAFDSSRYWQGTFSRNNKKVSVVATVAPVMGMPAASVLTSKVINAFRPKYVVMAGICAGVEDKAAIGDIIVADPCFDWGSGKWRRKKETNELQFAPAAYQWRLDTHLSTRIKALADTEGLLDSIRRDYTGDRPSNTPKVLIGPMASGGSVLQASMLMDDVKDQHKNLIGVDMELYGVFSACEYAAAPKPKCIGMKSVCDYGSEVKNDKFHSFAAYCSAKFMYEFAINCLIEQG